MKRELNYFKIDNRYGGSQDWFRNPMMRIGGCAAVAACETCIYLDLHHGTKIYPYEKTRLCKADYTSFGMQMKPYLHPRLMGINKLEIYIKGFDKYLTKNHCHQLRMTPLHGDRAVKEAEQAVKMQIDQNLPIPFLLLKHQNPIFRNYVWHWFILTGYEEVNGQLQVKAVTYQNSQWLDFAALWDTGYKRKGGVILYEVVSENKNPVGK